MAKYSRFDPRNKKQSRNKQRSIDKDLRLRREDDTEHKKYNKYDVNHIIDSYEEYEDGV